MVDTVVKVSWIQYGFEHNFQIVKVGTLFLVHWGYCEDNRDDVVCSHTEGHWQLLVVKVVGARTLIWANLVNKDASANSVGRNGVQLHFRVVKQMLMVLSACSFAAVCGYVWFCVGSGGTRKMAERARVVLAMQKCIVREGVVMMVRGCHLSMGGSFWGDESVKGKGWVK